MFREGFRVVPNCRADNPGPKISTKDLHGRPRLDNTWVKPPWEYIISGRTTPRHVMLWGRYGIPSLEAPTRTPRNRGPSGTSTSHNKFYQSIEEHMHTLGIHIFSREKFRYYHHYKCGWVLGLGSGKGNRIGRSQPPEQGHQGFSTFRTPTVRSYVSPWERQDMRQYSLSGCDLVATPFELSTHEHFLPLLHHIVLLEYVIYTIAKCGGEAFTSTSP